jgi:iron complex outermembrane receptor protein
MGRSGFWNDFSIRLSGVYAFEHSKPSTFETETSDYFLTHLKIEGKVNLANQEAQFGVAIDNLFDVQYINHLSTLKPLNYYNMGRNIVFSLKIPINYNY